MAGNVWVLIFRRLISILKQRTGTICPGMGSLNQDMQTERVRTMQPFSNVDVVGSVLFFVLLTAFFTGLGMPIHHGISPDLPKVKNSILEPNASRDDAMLVIITRNGYCYFGRERIAIEDISMKVRDGLSHGSERKIYIRADARTSYKDIKAVVDAIHQSGIENVAFVVDQRSPDLQKTSSFPRPIPSKQ